MKGVHWLEIARVTPLVGLSLAGLAYKVTGQLCSFWRECLLHLLMCEWSMLSSQITRKSGWMVSIKCIKEDCASRVE